MRGSGVVHVGGGGAAGWMGDAQPRALLMCASNFWGLQGFLLDKKIGVGQPKRIENARIMVANTSMDTDKIKVRAASTVPTYPFLPRSVCGSCSCV
jgi:hypothetical protein